MNADKKMLGCLLSLAFLVNVPSYAQTNIGLVWKNIKDKAAALRRKTNENIDTMVKVKNASELVRPTMAFISDLKQEVPELTALLTSLSTTFANLATVGKKKYDDPQMRKETMLVLFKNAINKSDELFDTLFSILYNLDAIILKASDLNLVEVTLSDELKQVLLACRAMARVTMKYFNDCLGPELIEFMYRLETISPEVTVPKTGAKAASAKSSAPKTGKSRAGAAMPAEQKEAKEKSLEL